MSVHFGFCGFVGIRGGNAASELAQSPPAEGISRSPHSGSRYFLRARFYHSTKFRLSAHFVLWESCWGCHPKPAFLRLAPLEKIHPRKEVHSHEKIQHAPPKPDNQDTLDRGRIRRVFRACHPLQNEPSRVYPASPH